MAKAGKSGVVEKSPNAQTIRFRGQFINLSAIARAQHLDVSYLSRIFRAQRTPSLKHCMKISAILGMTLDDFVQGLQDRAEEIAKSNTDVLQMHNQRIAKEDSSDIDTFKRGGVPAPRLPAFRPVLKRA
jgi:transcriptional regulator with XRE-family HTH domain